MGIEDDMDDSRQARGHWFLGWLFGRRGLSSMEYVKKTKPPRSVRRALKKAIREGKIGRDS